MLCLFLWAGRGPERAPDEVATLALAGHGYAVLHQVFASRLVNTVQTQILMPCPCSSRLIMRVVQARAHWAALWPGR